MNPCLIIPITISDGYIGVGKSAATHTDYGNHKNYKFISTIKMIPVTAYNNIFISCMRLGIETSDMSTMLFALS